MDAQVVQSPSSFRSRFSLANTLYFVGLAVFLVDGDERSRVATGPLGHTKCKNGDTADPKLLCMYTRRGERKNVLQKKNKNEFLSKLHKSKHCALKLQISLKIFEVDAPLLLLVNCFYLRHNTRVALDLGKVCDYHIHKECNVTCNQSRALPSSYSTWRKTFGFCWY